MFNTATTEFLGQCITTLGFIKDFVHTPYHKFIYIHIELIGLLLQNWKKICTNVFIIWINVKLKWLHETSISCLQGKSDISVVPVRMKLSSSSHWKAKVWSKKEREQEQGEFLRNRKKKEKIYMHIYNGTKLQLLRKHY